MCNIEMSSGETPSVYHRYEQWERHQVYTIEMSSGETPDVYHRDAVERHQVCTI